MALSNDIKKQAALTKNLLENKLPDKMVQVSQKLVDDSFRREKYQDGKSSKWKQRKNDPEAGKKRSDRRALLVEKGTLIESVEAKRKGKDVVIETDVEYADVHNQGLQAGRGAGFKMPQRQFMPIPGETFPKVEEIENWLDNELDKIFS